MADESVPISVPLRFEIKTVPTGMTEYDTSAIAPDQQNQLNDYKLNLVQDNYRYLASHPEVSILLHPFTLLMARPDIIFGLFNFKKKVP